MKLEEELFKLVKGQDLQKIKEIISLGHVNLKQTDENGNTFLHFAVKKVSENTLPLTQLLLENGLDPLSLNEDFQSPLDLATEINNFPALALMRFYMNKNTVNG